MQTPKEIIADIRREMTIQDINVSELASLIGMSSQNLSKILKQENPQLKSLIKICDGLGMKVALIKDDTK
jgi:DNA-binding phage protein